MMKTVFSLSLASAAVAEEDCLSEANVLLQIKQAEHGSLDMDDMEMIAGAETHHMDPDKFLDESDHGVNQCDRWCQFEHHRQEMCNAEDIQRNMPAERFCEWADPAFVEFPWDTMHLDHEYCLKRQECTHNELIHPQWIEEPEWHVAPNDPVQQCLDEAHDLIDWCNGDRHCQISKHCETTAELEGLNHDDHEAWGQHWEMCWNTAMRDLAMHDDYTINCQWHAEQEDHEAHERCLCENECSDNWTKWYFDQEGRTTSNCIHQCWMDHSDTGNQWLLQTRNRAQSYANRYASKSNLLLIQEHHHEEEERRCVWDEIWQTHEECKQGISEDDFFSQLPVADFCSHTTADDVWCVMEHACVHARQDEEHHRECMHHQQIEHDMCDVWCQIDHICAPQDGHHECWNEQKKLRPAEDFCDYCKNAGDWNDDPHKCMERCVAEHQCTDNWTKEWMECPHPSPHHDWHDWYQEDDVAQCLHYIWHPEQPFRSQIPDGCFGPTEEPQHHDEQFDAAGTWTDAANVDTTFDHGDYDEHDEDQCMGDCTYNAEHCDLGKRECGNMLFECAANCHPELWDATDQNKECASECKIGDEDCYKICFGHLFEHHDDHHEEGNYTNADGDMHYEDEWNTDPANTHYEDEKHFEDEWSTDPANTHYEDEWSTDPANTHYEDEKHHEDEWANSDASTTWTDDSWGSSDLTNFNAADGSFTNADDMDDKWLAQVRSRNQLKNRMYLHKYRK